MKETALMSQNAVPYTKLLRLLCTFPVIKSLTELNCALTPVVFHMLESELLESVGCQQEFSEKAGRSYFSLFAWK